MVHIEAVGWSKTLAEMLANLQNAAVGREREGHGCGCNKCTTTTDVRIICYDGFIPVHRFILQLVSSPFLTQLFHTHDNQVKETGDELLCMHLPDFKILSVQKFLQVLYSGFVNTLSEEELIEVREIMEVFGLNESMEISVNPTTPEDRDEFCLTLDYFKRKDPIEGDNDDDDDDDAKVENEIYGITVDGILHYHLPEPSIGDESDNDDVGSGFRLIIGSATSEEDSDDESSSAAVPPSSVGVQIQVLPDNNHNRIPCHSRSVAGAGAGTQNQLSTSAEKPTDQEGVKEEDEDMDTIEIITPPPRKDQNRVKPLLIDLDSSSDEEVVGLDQDEDEDAPLILPSQTNAKSREGISTSTVSVDKRTTNQTLGKKQLKNKLCRKSAGARTTDLSSCTSSADDDSLTSSSSSSSGDEEMPGPVPANKISSSEADDEKDEVPPPKLSPAQRSSPSATGTTRALRPRKKRATKTLKTAAVTKSQDKKKKSDRSSDDDEEGSASDNGMDDSPWSELSDDENVVESSRRVRHPLPPPRRPRGGDGRFRIRWPLRNRRAGAGPAVRRSVVFNGAIQKTLTHPKKLTPATSNRTGQIPPRSTPTNQVKDIQVQLANHQPKETSGSSIAKKTVTVPADKSKKKKPNPDDKPKAKAGSDDDDDESSVSIFHSSSDDQDDDNDSDHMKRKLEQFVEAAKRCGSCKVKYSSPREASDCIRHKHGIIRCHFCFKCFTDTSLLFAHYKVGHKQASKPEHLFCRFCKTAISYKSVSTHVISNHLFDKKAAASAVGMNGSGSTGTGSGNYVRPAAAAAVGTGPERPPTISKMAAGLTTNSTAATVVVKKSTGTISERAAAGSPKTTIAAAAAATAGSKNSTASGKKRVVIALNRKAADDDEGSESNTTTDISSTSSISISSSTDDDDDGDNMVMKKKTSTGHKKLRILGTKKK